MRNGFLLFLFLFGSTWFVAAQTPRNSFVGCLNRLPGGTLQLGVVPSGELFLVHGESNALAEHLNQLVRVSGEVTERATKSSVPPTLTVAGVQAVAGSCTSGLPAQKVEEVPGKVGEDLVAVPETSTLAEDQTTPGFQTQAAMVSTPHFKNEKQPAAPAHPDQVAQSEAAANVNASSVNRTEILPEHALGVIGTPGSAN